VLQFPNSAVPWTMDSSALVAKRRGAQFQGLFVNECGLFLYLREPPILHFGRVQRIADGRSILTACDSD
jgi:hypothetical protein